MDSHRHSLPRPPKRPLNAYMIWLAEMRGLINKDNPKVRMSDFAKNAGKIWKNLADKKVWLDKALKKRAEYLEAKSNYLYTCKSLGRPLGLSASTVRRFPRTRKSIRLRSSSSNQSNEK